MSLGFENYKSTCTFEQTMQLPLVTFTPYSSIKLTKLYIEEQFLIRFPAAAHSFIESVVAEASG